jgi:hypothetical protein
MREDLIQRVIKPADCTLAFGIPTSLQEYRRYRLAREDHDFISRFGNQERDFELAVLEYMERIIPAIEQTGARVERAITLKRFGALLCDPSRLVLTVFSHWNEDSVEFADGMAPISRIVKEVPLEYSGIVDLCVCNPNDLVMKLRQQRPRIALIRHTDANLAVGLWLWVYLELFKILQEAELTWLTALETTLDRLLEKLN